MKITIVRRTVIEIKRVSTIEVRTAEQWVKSFLQGRIWPDGIISTKPAYVDGQLLQYGWPRKIYEELGRHPHRCDVEIVNLPGSYFAQEVRDE